MKIFQNFVAFSEYMNFKRKKNVLLTVGQTPNSAMLVLNRQVIVLSVLMSSGFFFDLASPIVKLIGIRKGKYLHSKNNEAQIGILRDTFGLLKNCH